MSIHTHKHKIQGLERRISMMMNNSKLWIFWYLIDLKASAQTYDSIDLSPLAYFTKIRKLDI